MKPGKPRRGKEVKVKRSPLKMVKAGPAENVTSNVVPRKVGRGFLGITKEGTSLPKEERNRPRGTGRCLFPQH